MQVSDSAKGASSATLGAQPTRNVAMVQDASFLMMLSSNLYSNQILACIREPLCNAWDAHIDAGTTDLPIRITITEDHELIIADSGLGIPDDKIEVVYGTYGASTKKNDSKTTGGFGLGSKAPWAYVDTFRVISENNGIKTVYNMEKSTVENEGMPGITPVMSIPTDRSGLTVQFRLNEEDVEEVVRYIKAITLHGDMNVIFDNQLSGEGEKVLPKLNLEPVVGNYLIGGDAYENWYFRYMGKSSIFIRYGAVVYPILETVKTEKAVGLLREFMTMVGFQRLLVQAAPDTLALTPNREALSSNRMTEDGITDLCVALVNHIEEDLIAAIPGAVAATESKLRKGIDGSTVDSHVNPWSHIRPDAVRRYLNCSMGKAFVAKYDRHLKHAEHAGFKKMHRFKNAKATSEFHKLRKRNKNRRHYISMNDLRIGFAKRFIMKPLAKVFLNNPKIVKPKNLMFSDEEYWGRKIHKKDILSKHMRSMQFNNLKVLVDRPTVFIASNMSSMDDSIECCPLIGKKDPVWIYRVNNLDKNRKEIVKAFENAGYQAIDLGDNHTWDAPAQARKESRDEKAAIKAALLAAGKKPKVKVKNSLLSISNVYVNRTKRLSTDAIRGLPQTSSTTSKPLFYAEIRDCNHDGSIGHYAHILDLTQEEKEHGVIARTGTEVNMAKKRGAVHVNDYFKDRFIERIFGEEYKTYMTKERKVGIAEDLCISSVDMKLFKLLGIKMPGLDKLKYDPSMERLHKMIDGMWSHLRYTLLSGDPVKKDLLDDVVLKYKLLPTPTTEKLMILQTDVILRKLGHGKGVMELIQRYPERKAALKSLVLIAIKTGIKKP